MRLFFTFIGGRGHFDPLIPIARAAEAAGHELAFSSGPRMVPDVLAAGFISYATAPGRIGGVPQRQPLQVVDRGRELNDVREGFIRQAAPKRAEVLKEQFAHWRTDVVVCDEMDYGSLLAAEEADLPVASVVVNASGNFATPAEIADALHEVRVGRGLPPDPGPSRLARHLLLVPFPPRFRDPAFPLPASAHVYRPPVATPDGPAPWPIRHPGVPSVYVTLGTIFNLESGDLFNRVLSGLRELPINLVVTVGTHIDPAEFGPQPEHVHLARFIPQAQVLPHCDLVVSHAGSGSVIATLAHGLPSVLLPLGADQPNNAQRCQDLGIGQVLDCVTATPDDIRRAVVSVLTDPGYRQRAQAFRAEAAALPSVETVVPRLEALVLV